MELPPAAKVGQELTWTQQQLQTEVNDVTRTLLQKSGLVMALIGIVLIIPTSAYASDTTKSGWVFTQREISAGIHTVTVRDDAIRIDNQVAGYEIVAQAPTWDVTVFRNDDKTFYKCNLRKFVDFSSYGPMVHSGMSDQFKRTGSGTKDGLKLTSYYKDNSSTLTMVDGLSLAPQIGNILSIYYRIPVEGFPFQYVLNAADPVKIQHKLVTMGWKKRNVSLSEFVVPKGLRRVDTQSEILLSAAKKKQFYSIMDDMGLGVKLGK